MASSDKSESKLTENGKSTENSDSNCYVDVSVPLTRSKRRLENIDSKGSKSKRTRSAPVTFNPVLSK